MGTSDLTEDYAREIADIINTSVNDLIGADNLNDILRLQGSVRTLTVLQKRIEDIKNPPEVSESESESETNDKHLNVVPE